MSQGSYRPATVTLNNTPLASAKLTGLVSENSQVTLPSSRRTPASSNTSRSRPIVPSGSSSRLNSPEIIPARRISASSPRALLEETDQEDLQAELGELGYITSSKITVQGNNSRPMQYIKAVNQKGQTVFILLDEVDPRGGMTSDLTLIEAKNASIVPYSLKSGAFNCAGNEVCGVAFECANDALCTLIRSEESAEPREANFLLVEQHAETAATLQHGSEIMSYPVIKLSEIRANPALVLKNTDQVTRRLRNASYTSQLQELADMQQVLIRLGHAFTDFNIQREKVALNLNRTLTQLEEYNNVFLNKPPKTEEEKRKYEEIHYNLIQRNQWISLLLQNIRSVSEKRFVLSTITREIEELTQLSNKEFANVGIFNVP